MRFGFTIALLMLISGCNSEATVCPNPAICGTPDAQTDGAIDAPLDSGADAALEE